jgi:hypothetical protein
MVFAFILKWFQSIPKYQKYILKNKGKNSSGLGYCFVEPGG